MKNLLLNEWMKIRIPSCLTLIISVIAVSLTTLIVYKSYALEEQLEVYEVGFAVFNVFYPILAVLPTAWVMYFERKTNFIKYTVPRVKKQTYLFTKGMMSVLTGFVCIFSISIVSVTIALYVVPPITSNLFLVNPLTGELMSRFPGARIFGEVFVDQPFLYGLILSIWKGFIGAVTALFGFTLSLYSRNLFVILAGPFIYMILDNFVWNFIGPMKYSLTTAFEPSSIGVDYLTLCHFVLPPIQLGLIVTGYWIYMHIKLKKSVYEL